MTHQFVTLFDETYASRALALAISLERFGVDFKLWVICLDDASHQILGNLGNPKILSIPREDWQDDALLKLETERSRREFCWTMTPFSIQKVFSQQPEIDVLTYLDADLWFMSDPTELLNRIKSRHRGAFITSHAFSPSHADLAKYGQFNVQFLSIHRSLGEMVLSDWAKDCATWCFARLEDGKFGDQKYLDRWLTRYKGKVEVGEPQSMFQGPWNASHFQPSQALTYHFSSLSFVGKKLIRLAGKDYDIPSEYLDEVYRPYLDDLEFAEAQLRALRVRSGPRDRPWFQVRSVSTIFSTLWKRLTRARSGWGLKRDQYIFKRSRSSTYGKSYGGGA